MKILLVEDSERLRRSLAHGLAKSGFAVDLAADGEEGLAFAEAYEYTVIVLDLMLPRRSGLDVLRSIRGSGSPVHVLILSARDGVADRVEGLRLGADDYLVKPFAFDELVARLHALARRRHGEKRPRIGIADLVVDPQRREVTRGGRAIPLTPSELTLLIHLVLHRGRVVSKERLAEQLYRSAVDVSSNMIEVLIHGIRRKLDRPGEPSLITTRRGHGYLVDDEEG